MESQDDIRRRIQARIDELGLAVRGVSISAGLGETTLRNFLKGMTESLTVTSVEKLAGPLHTTPKWIIFGEEERASAEIINIWHHIPLDRRELAERTLRQFAER